MDSRCKRLVKLALTKENSNIPVAGTSADHDATLSSGVVGSNIREATLNVDDSTNNKADLSVSNRNRCDSTSSSDSSSSDSSSSSSSSNTSFHEDSDDSVKDPNYEIVVPRHFNQSFSDSDGEVANVNTGNRNSVLQENVNRTPTADHEIILNSLVQEADALPILNEQSGVENVNPTDQNPQNTDCSPTKKGKKRRRLEGSWKKNIAKKLRNSGKSYQSAKTKKMIPERKLRPPCRENCTFKCRKITDEQRQHLLKEFWNLGDIEKQWSFIANSVEAVIPKHRYVKIDSDGNVAPTRDNNNAFFFTVSGIKTRVCKLFFKNTLAINNRPIETALKKKNKDCNISSMKDERGHHANRYKLDENIKNGVKTFIEAIPKIEAHYIRSNSRRHYIDGSKTITDLHRDYVAECKLKNLPFANYLMFYRIFTQDYNISFFVPKKDLCDVCESYKNSTNEEKEQLKESYERHQNEKVLSRAEKENDKKNKEILVAVYDLEAVFQCPKGDVSVFYYKSKLNVLNLTIYNIQSNCVENYVWDESNAHRGVNEIGTCVYKYLLKVSETVENLDVVFYSDNCAGQQKNKFMICMYLYAVKTIPNLNSVTHKYLIKGHSQNEGDSAHSQIEREIKRQLRSGPMYTPDAFIGAIKAARKKSEPFHVNEMCFADFNDWKSLTNQMNFSLLKDENNDSVKLAGLKVIRVQKNDPEAIFFKYSYADKQFKKAIVIKKKRNISNLELKNAYNQKPGISEKKKADLMDLVNKNLIPRYHKPFYESL